MVERHPPDAAEAPVHSPELLFVFQLSGLFEVGILQCDTRDRLGALGLIESLDQFAQQHVITPPLDVPVTRLWPSHMMWLLVGPAPPLTVSLVFFPTSIT